MSLCGFPKRNWLGLQQPPPLIQSLLGFAARSCGNLSSWHWNPGLGDLVWVWDSSLPRYPSQIFIHVDMGPARSMSPPTRLDGCGFFNWVVVRLPFNSISDGFEWWLFCILVVILMWLCEKVSHVWLHRHLIRSIVFLDNWWRSAIRCSLANCIYFPLVTYLIIVPSYGKKTPNDLFGQCYTYWPWC